jgi:hypothetical protein
VDNQIPKGRSPGPTSVSNLLANQAALAIENSRLANLQEINAQLLSTQNRLIQSSWPPWEKWSLHRPRDQESPVSIGGFARRLGGA